MQNERRTNLRRYEDRNHKFLGYLTMTVVLAAIVGFSFGYYVGVKETASAAVEMVNR